LKKQQLCSFNEHKEALYNYRLTGLRDDLNSTLMATKLKF